MGRRPSAETAHRGLNRPVHVTILGMARQGSALARSFLARGAYVVLSDLRPAESLVSAADEIATYAAGLGRSAEAVRFVLGEHPLELLDETDLLCLSGGVSPAIPIVQEAIRRGIPISNDSLLTLEQCPVPVAGVTGSAGKTTTTTLVGSMLEAAGFRVHVGGNIGTPLIDRLDTIEPGDKVVLELSSFQLELFDRSPELAAVLNVTPNHLDRHPSMSHYAAAKANILRYQTPGDTCVLNADDPWTGSWLRSGRCEVPAGEGQEAIYFPLRGQTLAFSIEEEVAHGGFLKGDRLVWRSPGQPDQDICSSGEVRLRGRHNLANILAAACLARAAGAGIQAVRGVATSFAGVEHRLQIVRERNGVLWVNDSIATTPERAMAAIHAFSEPVVLLAGGRDKHLPWEDWAALVRQRTRQVVLFGEAAGLIGRILQAEGVTGVTACHDLPEAVAAAARCAQPGDVVLLSPGGTSFDAYVDFAARGRHFMELVEALS